MVVLYYLKIFPLYCSCTTEISSCVAIVLPEIFLFILPEIFTYSVAVLSEIFFMVQLYHLKFPFMMQQYYLKFHLVLQLYYLKIFYYIHYIINLLLIIKIDNKFINFLISYYSNKQNGQKYTEYNRV